MIFIPRLFCSGRRGDILHGVDCPGAMQNVSYQFVTCNVFFEGVFKMDFAHEFFLMTASRGGKFLCAFLLASVLSGCGWWNSDPVHPSSPAPVPAVPPVDPASVITAPNLSVSGGSAASGAVVPGDTITVVWNDSSTGVHNIAGVTVVSVTGDFTSLGGDIVSFTDPGYIWSATFTVPVGFVPGLNPGVLITATDASGNTYTFFDPVAVALFSAFDYSLAGSFWNWAIVFILMIWATALSAGSVVSAVRTEIG